MLTMAIRERLSEKRSLCIVGQKVEEDISLNGNNVGLQVD